MKVIGSKLRKWGTKSRLCDVIEIHGADRDKTELYQRMRHNLSASHITLPLHKTHAHTFPACVVLNRVGVSISHDNIKLAPSKQMQGHTGTDSC